MRTTTRAPGDPSSRICRWAQLSMESLTKVCSPRVKCSGSVHLADLHPLRCVDPGRTLAPAAPP